MKDTTFELSAEHLLALTYEEFNVFRQEYMIRMSSERTAPAPVPTTPMTPLTIHTPGSKTRQAFLSQHNDLFDEAVFESTETLLDQEKVDSSTSSPFQSSSNSPGSKQRLTRVHFHGNYLSPDNPPHDVEESCHLSGSTSTTDSLDESSTLSV